MYPAWTAERRRRFRTHYKAHGWTHLPFGIWGYYRDHGGESFDYRKDVSGFRWILRELEEDHMVPCVFVTTDQLPGQPDWSAQQGIDFAAAFVPQIEDLVPALALGWEQNQIAGWREDRNPRQGHDMIQLARTLKQVAPRSLVYAHWQPKWWGPHYSAGDEAKWWRDAGDAVDGYLHNDWESPVEDRIHYLLKLPSPHGWGPGVVGRLKGLGKDVIAFEMARSLESHRRIVSAVQADGRCAGWC